MNLYNLLKWVRKRLLPVIFLLGIVYLILILFPSIQFNNRIRYKNCIVYSDRNIDSNIKAILDSALMRINKSDLYDSTIHFKIFLCNDLWRFSFFAFAKSNAGAITHTHTTGNIFIRPSNIAENKVLPPGSWKFAKPPYSLADRPLSYFIAHEMTHRILMNYTGRLNFNTPLWINEGYADFIAKGEQFNFFENLELLKQHAPELDPNQGLYRNFHLHIYFLLRYKNYSIENILKEKPDLSKVNKELLASGEK